MRRADRIGHETDHGARTNWSTMILRGVWRAAEANPGFNTEHIARTEDMLSKFDSIRKFNYVHGEDVDRLAPEYQFKPRFISGDPAAQGLWSYQIKDFSEIIFRLLKSHSRHIGSRNAGALPQAWHRLKP